MKVFNNEFKPKKYYKDKLGFKSKDTFKQAFKPAAEIIRKISLSDIDSINQSIASVAKKINRTLSFEYQILNNTDIDNKINEYSKKCLENIDKMTNNGRSPYDVYQNLLLGFIVPELFCKYISSVFGVVPSDIIDIGGDYSDNMEKKSTADKSIPSINIRLEFQLGIGGKKSNRDIKLRKIEEAHKIGSETTFCVHIDLLDGEVAFINLNNINTNDESIIERIQLESKVYPIPLACWWDVCSKSPMYKDGIIQN